MTKESSGDVFSVTVTLPSTIRPGQYGPDVDCSHGSSAVATLHVTAMPGAGGAETGSGTTATATDAGRRQAAWRSSPSARWPVASRYGGVRAAAHDVVLGPAGPELALAAVRW